MVSFRFGAHINPCQYVIAAVQLLLLDLVKTVITVVKNFKNKMYQNALISVKIGGL